VDGLASSYVNLVLWLAANKPDLALLQETMAPLPVKFPGYTAHFGGALETLGRPKRGFAELASAKSQQTFALPPTAMPDASRWRTVSFTRANTIFFIIHVYFPQASKDAEPEVTATLAEIASFVTSKPRQCAWIIVGDFNARLGDSKPNLSSPKVIEWATNLGLTRLTPKYADVSATCIGPKGGTSVIDHVFTCSVTKAHLSPTLHSGFAPEVTIRHAYAFLRLEWKAPSLKNTFPLPCRVFSTLSVPPAKLRLVASSLSIPIDRIFNSIIEHTSPITAQTVTEWWASVAKAVASSIAPFNNTLAKRQHLSASKPPRSIGSSWQLTLWRRLADSAVSPEEAAAITSDEQANDRRSQWRDHETNLSRAMESLVANLKKNPKTFWKIVKVTCRDTSPTLPRTLLNKSSQMTTSKNEVTELWWEAFRRRKPVFPKFKPVHERWWDTVEADVYRWRHQPEPWEWGDRPIAKSEIAKVVKKMKKRGAPGTDDITIELLILLGDSALDLLEAFFNAVWENEVIPEQFLTDIIVPIFKRNSVWKASNYRPISLLQVCAKVLSTTLYNRIEFFLNCTGLETGFCGPLQYGGCRNRDLFLLLWTIDAVSASELWKSSNGGSIFILASDIKDAYPSIWQDAASWLLHEKGIKGKLWRLTHLLDSDLRSKLRINGHVTRTQRHADGGAQGSVSAGPRFNVIQEALMVDSKKCSPGFSLPEADLNIDSLGFVDDNYKLFGADAVKDIQRWLTTRDKLAAKWKCMFKPEKDQILIRGLLAALPHSFTRPCEAPLNSTTSIEALGHILTTNIGISPAQVKRTLNSMKAKARALQWLLSVNSLSVPRVASALFVALVLSVITSKLPLVRLSETQFDAFEKVQSDYAATLLGVPTSTPPWFLYADLGWLSVKATITKAKLLLAGRIFRACPNQDPTTASLAALRSAQVTEGDRVGLLGEVYETIESTGATPDESPLWYNLARSSTKQSFKTVAIKFVKSTDASSLSASLFKCDTPTAMFAVLKQSTKKETYVMLSLTDRSRFAQVRFSTTRAASDDNRRPRCCRLCKSTDFETIQHLVSYCPLLASIRRMLWLPRTVPTTLEPEDMWSTTLNLPEKKLCNFFSMINIFFNQQTGHPLFTDPCTDVKDSPQQVELANFRAQVSAAVDSLEF
jgi:hypothetical protein